MTTGTVKSQLSLGAFFLLCGIIGVAFLDVTAKMLLAEVTLLQVLWARFFFHFLFLTPFALLTWCRSPQGRGMLGAGNNQRWELHALRGVLLLLASLFFFLAIRDNPIPDSLTVFFIEPLIVIVMARFFLNEKINHRFVWAAVCGFIGVLVVLRPGGTSDYQWTIIFAVVAACCFAGYLVATRFASLNTSVSMNSWLTAGFGLLPILPFIFFSWTPINEGRVWLLMVAVGFFAGLGHSFIALACRYAPASYIAILHYTEVGVSVLLSWWLFSHIPDIWVWVGMAIIACANIYALHTRRDIL